MGRTLGLDYESDTGRRPHAKSQHWHRLCKRTEYPKLGYIIHRLHEEGIPCSFDYAEDGREVHSWHADHILLVSESHKDEAWDIMSEKWSKAAGKRSNKGRTTLDDMPDDHPAFADYHDVDPEDAAWGDAGYSDPVRDGWVGKDGLP